MVLRGNMLFIFKNDKTQKENMVGSLTLNSDTDLQTGDGDKKYKKKDNLGFKLVTRGDGNSKVNFFKFERENDRDLWRSFILAITQGIVPADVHLLPGQLRDVYEVIGDKNKPPPLPSTTIPRPRLNPDMTSPGDMRGTFDDAPTFMNGSNGYPGRSKSGGDDSPDSGSFSSHMTRNTRSNPPPPSGAPVRSLRDLQRRQSEMTDRDLGFVDDGSHSSHGNGGHVPYLERQSSHQSYRYQEADRSTMSYAADNNNETHMFYRDSARNRDIPSWFFDRCDRSQAECLLTSNRKFGNVLMRPSTTFPNNHKYVISMRRDVSGGTNLNHYEVVRCSEGYSINVDNKHAPMKCLSEVMDYFIGVAGPSAQPMKSNNMANMDGACAAAFAAGSTMTSHFNSSGFDSATENHWQDTVSAGSSNVTPGIRQTIMEINRDLEQHAPQSPPPPPLMPAQAGHMEINGGRTLCIQGNVTSGIRQTIMEINEDLEQHVAKSPPPLMSQRQPSYTGENYENDSGHRTTGYYGQPKVQQRTQDIATAYNPGHQYGSQPSTPTQLGYQQHPAYPSEHQAGPYENVSEWQASNRQTNYNGGGLNQTVPARHTPLETLQRQAGHVNEVSRGMDVMSINPNDHFPSEQAPQPPPLPTGGRPSMPFNTMPPAPMLQQGYGAPQPPQMGYGSPPPQQPSFNTTPAGGARGRGMFGGAMSFEDELTKRMVRQKEQIYASGATVLRSANWN